MSEASHGDASFILQPEKKLQAAAASCNVSLLWFAGDYETCYQPPCVKDQLDIFAEVTDAERVMPSNRSALNQCVVALGTVSFKLLKKNIFNLKRQL